jgi:hypothetical protein
MKRPTLNGAAFLLLLPALLFMSSLAIRQIGRGPLAQLANAVVMAYATQRWTLWVLLLALPGIALLLGLRHSLRAASIVSTVILAIVALHMGAS